MPPIRASGHGVESSTNPGRNKSLDDVYKNIHSIIQECCGQLCEEYNGSSEGNEKYNENRNERLSSIKEVTKNMAEIYQKGLEDDEMFQKKFDGTAESLATINEKLKSEKSSKKKKYDGTKSDVYKNLERFINDKIHTNAVTSTTTDDVEMDNAEDSDNSIQEDEQIALTQVKVNLICPFSQKEMTEPVMHKKCKHTYEKSVIMGFLKDKPVIKCPFVSCGSITADDLVPHEEYEKIIRERAEKRKLKQKSQY